MMFVYDEARVVSRLSLIGPHKRSQFAAACAQMLLPVHERYERAQTQRSREFSLSEAVDVVWQAIESGSIDDDAHQLRANLESLIPRDHENEWEWESGLAQNAYAAAAYAVGSMLSGDVQEAGWTATQVYEAADYIAVNAARAPADMYPTERALAGSVAVQGTLASLERWICALESNTMDARALREDARSAGGWLGSLVG